jgi:hypothetical protein
MVAAEVVKLSVVSLTESHDFRNAERSPAPNSSWPSIPKGYEPAHFPPLFRVPPLRNFFTTRRRLAFLLAGSSLMMVAMAPAVNTLSSGDCNDGGIGRDFGPGR